MYSMPTLPAIGRLQGGEDLRERRRGETEQPVDEDRPVVIGFGEAIGLGIEIGMIGPVGQAERVEIGDHVTARAIGANEIHGAHRIEGGLMDLFGQGGDGVAVPRAAHGGGGRGVTIDDEGRGRPSPGRPFELLLHRGGLVAQLGEEALPALIDAGVVLEVAGVQLGDVLGVLAGQEGGLIEWRHGWIPQCNKVKIGISAPNN